MKLLSKILLTFLSVLLLLGFTFAVTYAATDSSIETQIRSLENNLSKIEKERSEAKKALNTAKSNKNNQLAIKRQYDNEIVSLESLILTTEELIGQYDASITKANEDIKILEGQLEEQELAFEDMIRMSFMYGNDNYLQMIFDSGSFSDLLSRLDMVSYLLSYNKNIIDGIVETEDQLRLSTDNLQLSKDNLTKYVESKALLKEELDKKSSEAQELINSFTKDEKSASATLKEIEASKKQLEEDIAALAKQYNKTGEKYSGGIFIWPVDQRQSTSSGWEWRINPISKKREFHNGLDIPAPRGTKIFAASGGTVVKAAWYGGYGNCVIINHGGGVMTLYGHCNSLNVKEGQSVKQGDTIAFVGSTGYSTGNHLHFTVYENGNTAVNPWNYLK
jgi:murein DD-endopeptidase MepM/ murein hydrolase activator NlpD